MAYFSNGNEGMAFENQCAKCKYGNEPCPIAWVQMDNNYEACNNEVARKILDSLVKDDGTCTVFELMKSDLKITDLPLFPELVGKRYKEI